MAKEGEQHSFVKWFSELSNKDVAIAGGKGASLAEMYNNKFPIPPGFMITAQSYAYFIERAGLKDKINEILNSFNVDDTEELDKHAKIIRDMISSADMPKEMSDEIVEAYDILDVNKEALQNASAGALKILKNSFEPPFVAVRSSATTEDLADASFAGQQESFLNVKGHKELIQKVKECFASLFTARAIYYRKKKGFAQDKSYLAVVVQKMIDSDKSGVIFSRDPTGAHENIVIEAVWGLGEGIVSGMIKPDNYVVDKNLDNYKVLSVSVPVKKIAVVRDSSGSTKTVKLREDRGSAQVLTNYEIKILAQYARKLEEHYKKPQDIEFAIQNDIYIVQSRPITTLGKVTEKKGIATGEILLSGLGASPGVASGIVKIVHTIADLSKIQAGDVLVTEMTNPDMVVTMQRAAAIVTNEGGVTSHAAIVSREMGIPAVVGTEEATTKLTDGEVITVDGTSGKVFIGSGESRAAEINPIVPTKTKIKVIVDLPNFAKRAAKSGAKAIGLTRIEGLIASSGKHPLAYVKEKKIGDYVNMLYKGLSTICEPFEEIWVRSSDIRSDEFRNLEGEPKEVEGNPMLGNHGIRFGLKHPEILRAEISAIKKIAEQNPNKKIGLMMPQIISVSELRETKKIAAELKVPDNVKIGIMVETPAAVQIINQLCEEGIAFASFGSNDLTQYMLAIDRNNSEVQYIYDEMNPAVTSALSYVIRRCKKYGVETSICGQAGSKEEMVRFLVGEGIDSISVNADAAEKISKLVAELEKNKHAEQPHVKKEKGFGAKLGHYVYENMPQASVTEHLSQKELKKHPEYKEVEKLEKKEFRQIMKEDDNRDTHDEYRPNASRETRDERDIPQLNDAIPVESELIEEESKKEQKELESGDIDFDLNKELTKSEKQCATTH